jgi:5-oxoprolinase (ATP-hydrolysing)/N-methylhydantoinase B
MEALVPMQINGLSDRFIYGASGFEGGESGATGAFLIKRAGCDEWKTVVEDSGRISPSKFADIRVEPGDRVLMMSPGGGGFGHPTDRDRVAVAEDLLEGYISRETALEVYGYDMVSGPGATP